MIIISVLYLAVAILTIVGYWKVYEKAGQPGWGVLIPIYNAYLFLKMAGKPGWWLLLLFIPLVNIVIAIIATVTVAKAFGKSVGFALLMIFLPFVAYPMLGFGDATYTPPPPAV